MKTVILVPTYNEKDNIGPLVKDIFHYVSGLIEVWVIDDSSPDGTGAEVEKLMTTYPSLRLLVRPEKNGLGEAYKFAKSRVLADPEIDRVVTMDADGSHDPRYLPEMLAALNDYDLVIGSRYVKGGGIPDWELWRRLLSRGGNLYARILTGLPLHDLTAGFTAFRRPVLQKIMLEKIGSAGYAYLMEFKYHAVRAGALIKEVPILFKERRGGESKISNHIISEGLKTPLKIFLHRL